jgi:acetyltransferase-like isoleucine patch superfamily enzyme
MTIIENISHFLTRSNRPKEGRRTPLILWIIYFCWNAFTRIRTKIILTGYSSSTIAVYFRKQGAQIGENCDININDVGTEPHLVKIGNHVFISKGVNIHTHDGGVWVLRDKIPDIRVSGPVVIEDNCIIGVNANILPNVHIGMNSIVGAGSVVISDVPPNSIVMGVPARVIGSVQKYEEKSRARWNEQRPPDLNMSKGPEWWRLKENRSKIRRHLTNLFNDPAKQKDETGK